MEKMRRARINDSLNEMKSLVLDLLHKDVSLTFLRVAFKNQNNQIAESGLNIGQNINTEFDKNIYLLTISKFCGFTLSLKSSKQSFHKRYSTEYNIYFFIQASRYSKMEKADVLEMTVTFLKAMQQNDSRTEGKLRKMLQ